VSMREWWSEGQGGDRESQAGSLLRGEPHSGLHLRTLKS